MTKQIVACLAVACAVGASPVVAAPFNDAVGDFLPTYTGPKGGDMDVVSSEVTIDLVTNKVKITGKMNGPIRTTPGAFYVWGFNRGVGTERFVTGTPSVGAGVKFDLSVQLRPDGTGQVGDIAGGVTTQLGAGAAIISGDTITSVEIPLSLFPSKGFAVQDYTWNLWPRVSTVSGNAAIPDFAPDSSNVPVTVIVPEPTGVAAAGLLVGLAARRRRA